MPKTLFNNDLFWLAGFPVAAPKLDAQSQFFVIFRASQIAVGGMAPG